MTFIVQNLIELSSKRCFSNFTIHSPTYLVVIIHTEATHLKYLDAEKKCFETVALESTK